MRGVVDGSVSHFITLVFDSVLVVIWFSVHYCLRSPSFPAVPVRMLETPGEVLLGLAVGLPRRTSVVLSLLPLSLSACLPGCFYRSFLDAPTAVKLDPAGVR